MSSHTPARVSFYVRIHNSSVVPCTLTRRPFDFCATWRVRATQQGAIRTIRTWDNHHWARPIRDVRRARRHVSGAEVERRSGSRPSSSKQRLFSSLETSAVIEAPRFRVRRIFQSHFGGDLQSLFRGSELNRKKQSRLKAKAQQQRGRGISYS